MISRMDKDILIHLERFKAASIKQIQRIMFPNDPHGYDYARMKMRNMEKRKILKSYKNSVTHEKIYYITDKLSAHDLFVMDFYSKLIEFGCTNVVCKREPRYMDGQIRPDGFFSFQYANNMYFVLLEVDLTHFSNMDRFQMYEALYKSGELQKQCYGTFPQLVVMGVNTLKYDSKNFELAYVDFDLEGFLDVLGLAI